MRFKEKKQRKGLGGFQVILQRNEMFASYVPILYNVFHKFLTSEL